jgi:hypothetical protein
MRNPPRRDLIAAIAKSPRIHLNARRSQEPIIRKTISVSHQHARRIITNQLLTTDH